MSSKEKLLDITERAAWTFAQAAVAVELVTNQPFSKAGLVAAAAAGFSAVKNYVKSLRV